MEEGETLSLLSRKELRKQKLMEYLAEKGRLKLPNPKPYLRDDNHMKKTGTSSQKDFKEKENKYPSDIFKYATTKIATPLTQATTHPVRKAFGITNKVNVKGKIVTGWQNGKCLSATSGSTQPQFNRNSGLTEMNTTLFPKSNHNTASHLKKQPNGGLQSSCRATSTAGSNSRLLRRSNAALSVPEKTGSIRMSLGPIVKTKTGLVPAVTQPMNRKRSVTNNFSRVTTSSAANKIQSSSSSSIPFLQKSTVAEKNTLSVTTLNVPVNKRITASSTKIKENNVQDQSKANSKPLLDKPPLSCKGELSSGLRTVLSKCRAEPIKPDRRGYISKTSRTVGDPSYRLTKQKSEEKNEKPCKVPSQKCRVTAVGGVTRAVVAELGEKSKTSKGTRSKKGHSTANAPLPQANVNKTGARMMSQPARSISHTGPTTNMKTPKVPVMVIPQTEVKKLTAAQEERMRKLQEWREAKGISYKRPPMPVKHPVRHTVAMSHPFWTAMKEEDDAHSLICAVDRSLADCIKLLGEGCPPEQVKEVLSRLPTVSQKFAKYWICQVRLMEREGKLDVLPVFEEAVRDVLEPIDELRTVVFEILKKKDTMQASEANEKEDQIPTAVSSSDSSKNSVTTPKPARVFISGEKGDSSVVKYKITATPGGPPSQWREPAQVNGQEVRFFTPVRRSVRIERASLRYPVSLQDHDICVASQGDLIFEEDKEKNEGTEGSEISPSVNDTPIYIYRQNEALKDKVLVKLHYD